MPILIPLISGLTATMTIALTYETSKHAKRKFYKKSNKLYEGDTARYQKRDS